MADKLSVPNGVRNPLGIIALFISFIYALSTTVLGVRIKEISLFSQHALIIFIILFPVVVFGAFTYLVIRHHKKLYGPGDFKDDRSFLETGDSPNVAERLAKDVTEAAPEEPEVVPSASSQSTQSPHHASSSAESLEVRESSSPRQVKELIERAYVAETLAIQKLQQELGATVRRNVKLIARSGGAVEVDAILDTESDRYIVELKYRDPGRTLIGRTALALKQLVYVHSVANLNALVNHHFMVVVVSEGATPPESVVKARMRVKSVSPPRIQFRHFQLEDLRREFGFE
ncbi:hypothetical protein [Caulobacter sp. NIBR1757]|uniref:hypothetical protein n=1 Tax=Caulobacter sp. NIBR1757 TaxID=3016000 RepID=UPI0022F0EA25|nr:hypothetical protein [Caulobacter sp. NIBR1757]WGM39924.1 hypothetical protein AMEJIAPC_02864 [Caulobacter sp. NIBR1757]